MSEYNFKDAMDRIKNGKLAITDVSNANYLKMKDWTRVTGAVYPVLTREMKWRPQFLLDSPKHNPLGLGKVKGDE